eukprot:4856605-Alexandrium_andersonii.AAC.1
MSQKSVSISEFNLRYLWTWYAFGCSDPKTKRSLMPGRPGGGTRRALFEERKHATTGWMIGLNHGRTVEQLTTPSTWNPVAPPSTELLQDPLRALPALPGSVAASAIAGQRD